MELDQVEELATRWQQALSAWAIPDAILAAAVDTPWFCDPADYRVDTASERDAVGVGLAAEVLPPTGARVLDVGCGPGRASVPLVPPAATLIGVDERPEMLAEYMLAASAVGASAITITGRWPEVSVDTPTADVAVCQHVAFNVGEIVPFLIALTDAARLAVVMVLPERHPMSNWNPAWKHFWNLERPTTPRADDVIEILRALDEDPEVVRYTPELPTVEWTPARVDAVRRRLCLPLDRIDEVAEYVTQHPIGYPAAYVALRWPGRG